MGPLPAAHPAQHPSAAPLLDLEPVPQALQANAATDVGHRARGARGRHRVVGRRAVHRRTRLEQAAVGQGADADGGGTGVHRRPLRRTLPDDQRLGHHAPARGPAARGVRLHQEKRLLGDDHPQEVRRPRILGLRALLGRRENREPLRNRRFNRGRAEFARAGRAPDALRHGGTTCPLSPAPRARRRNSLLRPDRTARGLGCELDPRHRHRLQGHLPGPRGHRHPPQLLEALHHARADRDAGRTRLPPVRSRSPAWRR